MSIRSGEPADAPACAAILNDWIDRTGWMPRIHPAEDVVRHYQQFVFAKRDVFVIGDPIEGY
ncbi:MAG: GNAT family N-acetyltransferase, partial [Pseudomonadota bacterium]